MFTVILEKNILFYLMAAAGVVGIITKLISCMTIRRLMRAAENMAKSSHRLMKLIRAKFEHASMVSDKVQNVDAFVDKYLFEYRVWGVRIHTWRELEKQMIWLSGLIAAVGVIGSYNFTGIQGQVLYYSAGGIIEMALLYLLYQWGDQSHAWNMIHTYIVDYLENVCAHKMAKTYHPSSEDPAESSDHIAREMSRESFREASRESLREARREPRKETSRESRRETKREPLRETSREPLRETSREPLRETSREPLREASREPLRETSREPLRETSREPLRETSREPLQEPLHDFEVSQDEKRERRGIAGVDVLSTTEAVDDPAVAIQIDEARRNMEKDAEERKVMIREILEQYLA